MLRCCFDKVNIDVCTSAFPTPTTYVLVSSSAGRTMYVIPFSMGPVGSSLTKYGVQVLETPKSQISLQTFHL